MFSIISGCATRQVYNKQFVTGKIKDSSGYDLPDQYSDTVIVPPEVTIDNGLTEQESVSIALWNSPQLQADLADLGFAHADLVEAGMLPNPVFSLLFPVGPKQLEFTLSYYADILWQRPSRIAVAKLNSEKIAENLILHGLNMIHNVSVSYADLYRAEGERNLLEEKMKLDNEIARIASVRKESGEISELEETAFKVSASQLQEAFIVANTMYETLKIKFLTQLGLISKWSEIQIEPSAVEEISIPDSEKLVSMALAFRPDMRASEIEIETAGKKLGWERAKIFNLTALLDANAQGKEGFEMGPGMQLNIPLLNFNNGGRLRARTEMQRAAASYIVVQQSIRSQVLQSWQNYQGAISTYNMLKKDVIPLSEKAVTQGEFAYLSGEISYLDFLEFNRQSLDANLRLGKAESDVRKSLADLYLSIGGKVILNNE